MKTFTQEELKLIIEKHGKWLRSEVGGERADLRSANLSFANLSSADLRSANLSFANLSSADLRFVDLRSANLSFANLSSADLRFVDLSSANLSFANLSSANLSFANLSFANLSSADLRSANLSFANLSSADLRSANLSFANLSSADLRFVDLSSANSFWSTIGNGVNLKSLQTNNWVITYTDTIMQIGCQKHLITKWFKFSDEEIGSMDTQALAWWKEWKPLIKKIIKISPCEPTGFIETKE